MKMKKILALVLAAVMALALVACGGGGNNSGNSGNAQNNQNSQDGAGSQDPDTSGTPAGETISLTLWGAEEDQALLVDLVEKFKAAYPDQTFDIKIGEESESTAKDTILTDIEAAADVFAFANDQIDDLIAAGALLPISGDMDAVLQNYAGKSLEDIKAANSAATVALATRNDTMYAFPMGGGNNYFLYYDSTRVTPEQAQTWDGLLEAANAAGSKMGMTLNSGWYNASFFLGAGFTTALNADGSTSVDWNGTSSKGITGVQVVQGMQAIAADPGFLPIADGDISNQINAGNVCAVISGTWDAEAAQKAFGDGYAATKLPTFTCAGQQVQMGCFSGGKLIGVNAYAKNSGWAVLLAEFLTNEESQVARFNARQQAPSNINAAADPAVQENVAISASAAQDAFGVVQSVGGKYWDPAKSFGEQIAQGTIATDDASIQTALDDLVAGVTAPLG